LDRWSCYQEEKLLYDWGRGDGTVPVESARRLGKGATIFLVNAQESDDEADHNGMLRHGRVQDCIQAVLRAETCGALTPVLTGEAMVAEVAPPAEAAYYLEITGAARVTIADVFGNTTDSISGTLSQAIPNLSSYQPGTVTDLFVMPADQDYTVTVQSGASPLSIDLRRGTGDRTDAALRYRDLNLPPNTTATLRITTQGIEVLRADTNGDGSFETTPRPTADLTGAAAADVEPPVVRVTVTGSLNQTTVTLSATDNGAGVQSIHYSLDDVTFETYSGPIVVDARRSPTIIAFADDKAANRSGEVTTRLAVQVWLPFLHR